MYFSRYLVCLDGPSKLHAYMPSLYASLFALWWNHLFPSYRGGYYACRLPHAWIGQTNNHLILIITTTTVHIARVFPLHILMIYWFNINCVCVCVVLHCDGRNSKWTSLFITTTWPNWSLRPHNCVIHIRQWIWFAADEIVLQWSTPHTGCCAESCADFLHWLIDSLVFESV